MFSRSVVSAAANLTSSLSSTPSDLEHDVMKAVLQSTDTLVFVWNHRGPVPAGGR